MSSASTLSLHRIGTAGIRESATLAPLDVTATPTDGTGVTTSHVPEPASAAEEVIGAVVALTVAASSAADTSTDDPSNIPWDLDGATNRDLRRWSNKLFKALDADFPAYGVLEDFDRVSAEIERREEAASASNTSARVREKFRDNAQGGRFELFRDGVLTGYVVYRMRAGVLRLHRTVVLDAFDSEQVEGILIHNLVLTAHQRRLAVVPYCPIAQSFFRQNPQYRQISQQ